jgi:ribosome-binding protein aMBF1 (putative translation factor)
MTTDTLKPSYRTIKGRRMVLLSEAEFNELMRQADLGEPALPEPDADGNRPADAYAAVSQARGILRARRKLGLSQVDLARRAGIRPETLNRIEHGKNAPSVPTIAKIDKALKQAAKGG